MGSHKITGDSRLRALFQLMSVLQRMSWNRGPCLSWVGLLVQKVWSGCEDLFTSSTNHHGLQTARKMTAYGLFRADNEADHIWTVLSRVKCPAKTGIIKKGAFLRTDSVSSGHVVIRWESSRNWVISWEALHICWRWCSNVKTYSMRYAGCASPLCTMTTSSNGNIFRVTGPLCGEFTGQRWIPLTKASDAELLCFLWSVPEQTVD